MDCFWFKFLSFLHYKQNSNVLLFLKLLFSDCPITFITIIKPNKLIVRSFLIKRGLNGHFVSITSPGWEFIMEQSRIYQALCTQCFANMKSAFENKKSWLK